MLRVTDPRSFAPGIGVWSSFLYAFKKWYNSSFNFGCGKPEIKNRERAGLPGMGIVL